LPHAYGFVSSQSPVLRSRFERSPMLSSLATSVGPIRLSPQAGCLWPAGGGRVQPAATTPAGSADSAAKCSARSAFRRNCWRNGRLRNAAPSNRAWCNGSAPPVNSTCSWHATMGPTPWPQPYKKPMPRVPSAPLCDDISDGGVRRATSRRCCRQGRGFGALSLGFPSCSTSAPIICGCSPGWNTAPVSCFSCKTTSPPGLSSVRLQPRSSDRHRRILLRFRKGQPRRQTVPGHRVGQAGHETPLRLRSSDFRGRRRKINCGVAACAAGEKSGHDCCCWCPAVSVAVCLRTTGWPSGPLNRLDWLRSKPALNNQLPGAKSRMMFSWAYRT